MKNPFSNLRGRTPRWLSLRSFKYFLFAAAGWTAFFFPRESVDATTDDSIRLWFSIFWALFSTISLLGALLDSWIIESVGLPGLSAVFFFLGFATLFFTIQEQDPRVLSAVLANFGFSIFFLNRYLDLKHRIDEVRGIRNENGNGNGNSV